MGSNRILRAIAVATAGVLSAIALAGCGPTGSGNDAAMVMGKDQGPQLETRQANSSRAAGSGEFEFVRYTIDVTKDLPRACLAFSSSLNPATDYRPFVDMGDGPQIALSVEGSSLCLGGLKFGDERAIKIRSGLRGASSPTGRRMKFARPKMCSASISERPYDVSDPTEAKTCPR